jgi:tripartite-type tricarboxylate transporter receptor subunit TctC
LRTQETRPMGHSAMASGRARRPGRRLLITSAIVLTGWIGVLSAAQAQPYPSRPIKVLNPYAPGGAVDVVARIIADPMRQSLGQPVVIENRPGAVGRIALEEAARAKPDGYTLQFGNTNSNAITPVLYKSKMSFDYRKEIVAVARVADVPAFVVATTRDFPPSTFNEFLAYAKANPGKVRYSSVGVGSFPHFDMEILARKAGLSLIHIPNKAGAAGSLQDLATGDAQVGFLNLATAGGLIRSGQLRPLAIITEERSPDYPDVPTLKELGYPGVGTLQWLALFAPAEVSGEVKQTLHRAVADALKLPSVQENLRKQNMRITPSTSPEDAQNWALGELTAWERITQEIKVDITD